MNRFPVSGCLLLIGTLALSGCYTTTGTTSRDPVAYLQISGTRGGLTAIVDDLAPIAVAPKEGQTRLQIAPGRHRIRILQGGTVLVDRTVLVSDLQTLEIPVP